MSDTPRTDGVESEHGLAWFGITAPLDRLQDYGVRMVNHARKLERELRALAPIPPTQGDPHDELIFDGTNQDAPSQNAQSELVEQVIPEWIEKQMGPGFKNMYDHNNWTLTVGAIRVMRGMLFDKTQRITELEQRNKELKRQCKAWEADYGSGLSIPRSKDSP